MQSITTSVDWFISKLNAFLSSRTGLVISITIPLLVIFMPAKIQQVENILSSNWTQLWALFVLGIMSKQVHTSIKKHHTEQMAHIDKHFEILHHKLGKKQ